jgi:CubicO group peptidase (beta-lactamase class C family)
MPNVNSLANDLEVFKKAGHCSAYYFSYGNIRTGIFHSLGDDEIVFDLSSLTKALVTTPLLLMLETRQLLRLELPLNQLQFSRALRGLTSLNFIEIMRHQSGLPAWRNFYVDALGELFETPLLRAESRLARVSVDPKKKGLDVYSDVGMILVWLGLVKHFGKSIAQQFVDEVCTHIGFDLPGDFGFSSQLHSKVNYAPSGYCNLRKRDIVGEVQDENCWRLGGETCHAGLFSSGKSLVCFLKTLLSCKFGSDLLQRNFALVKPGNPGLLGWRQGNDPINARFGSGKAMGHLGFTGCAFWIDYNSQNYVVLLTNRLLAGRDPSAIKQLRSDVFGKAYAALNSCPR